MSLVGFYVNLVMGPRTQHTAFNPEGLIANPPPDRVLPKEQRASREMLMAVTNSYFDGITTHDGTVIMAHSGCARTENGTGMGQLGGGARGTQLRQAVAEVQLPIARRA